MDRAGVPYIKSDKIKKNYIISISYSLDSDTRTALPGLVSGGAIKECSGICVH